MRVKRLIALVADDEPDICQMIRDLSKGLTTSLAFLPDAHDGKQALASILKHRPDLAILDIQMPRLSGRDVLDEILRRKLKTRVLFVTAHNEASYFDVSFWGGALGIFYKCDMIGSDGSNRFVLALKEILTGLPYVSPTPLNAIRRLLHGAFRKMPEEILSHSERDVLNLLVDGKADKEIAGEMRIAIQTVERRKQSMRRKLGVRSTAQLTAYAARYWKY